MSGLWGTEAALMHVFEDDLPSLANFDDLTAAMARILVGEIEVYLGKVAEFQRLHGAGE